MTRDEHIEKGRASLIPECCIQWWVDHDFRDFSRAQEQAPCQYVPCPDCAAAGRFVDIHICDNDDDLEVPCSGCGYTEGPHRAFVRQPTTRMSQSEFAARLAARMLRHGFVVACPCQMKGNE